MRGLFVLSLVAVALPSFASYDLVLVLDNDPAGMQVKRYDGQSGAYFGSFGQGFLTGATSIASDVNSSTALVGSGGSLKLFNYSTGEYIGATSGTNARSLTFGYNFYYALQNSATAFFTRVATSGTATSVGLPYSAAWSWITTGIDGSLLIGDAATGDIYRTTVSNPNSGSWARIFDGSATALSATNPAVVSYQFGVFGNGVAEVMVFNAAGNWNWIDWSNTSYFGVPSAGSYGLSPFTSISGMATAHLGTYVVGMNGATAQAARYDNFHAVANVFGSTQLKAPVAVSTVLAPEPATWLVSIGGLASLVLLRRRHLKV